jgi:hypothetical protein
LVSDIPDGDGKIDNLFYSVVEGGLALMEDKVKEQVAGLELQHMFVLCGNSALDMHLNVYNIDLITTYMVVYLQRFIKLGMHRRLQELC